MVAVNRLLCHCFEIISSYFPCGFMWFYIITYKPQSELFGHVSCAITRKYLGTSRHWYYFHAPKGSNKSVLALLSSTCLHVNWRFMYSLLTSIISHYNSVFNQRKSLKRMADKNNVSKVTRLLCLYIQAPVYILIELLCFLPVNNYIFIMGLERQYQIYF